MEYEVYRDGKLVAFTSTNSFVDTEVSYDKNVIYKVVPFDKNLNEGQAVEVSSYKPAMTVQQNELTLKLREEFNPMDLVKVYNYKGEDITSAVKVEGSIDTSKKGNYELTYSITDQGITVEELVKVKVVSDYDYLSDYEWEFVETDYSTATPRRNSNIKGRVNGDIKTFEKGVGIHANGKIVYDLPGKDYDTFEALLGVDMNIASQDISSITFKIIGDGKILATTRMLKHADDMVYINVPIKGVEKLTIEVHDGGNGISSDHAIIVNPKLNTNNVKPLISIEELTYVKLYSEFDLMSGVSATDQEDGNMTLNIVIKSEEFDINKIGEYTITYTVEDSDSNVVTKERKVVVYSEEKYLSDINWELARTDYGTVKKDRYSNNSNVRLLIDGASETFEKGIGTHANSKIVYNLAGKNYEYFEAYIGVDRNIPEQNNSSVIFKILAYGEEVYNSGVMKYNTEAKIVKIPVKGVNKLELIVNNANNGNSSDHGNFADAKFLITNSKPKLTIPNSISTKLGQKINLNQEFKAIDAEDGDISSKVEVSGKVNFYKPGKYNITYKVTDSDGNEVTKTRNVAVVNMSDYKYLTDYDWKSTQNGYSAPIKDKATSGNALRLTGSDGKEVRYERGIGSVSLEVDINGAKELKLVVTDGRNGNGSDHATWADAKLHFANSWGESIESEVRIELRELLEYAETITKDMVGATKHIEQRWDNFVYGKDLAKECVEDYSKTDEEIKYNINMLNYYIGELYIK